MAFLAHLRANRRAVDKMVHVGARRRLLVLLHDANDDLREQLRRRGIRGDSPFTVARLQVARAEVADAVRRVQGKARDELTSMSLGLGRMGVKHAVETVRTGERHFKGVAYDLPIERALRMDAKLTGRAASLLRQHDTSLARYGARMVGDFERQMRLGMMANETQDQIVDRLVEHGGPDGIFGERRWWAERIVRTELMYSYNGAAQLAAEEMAADFPDMRRIILAWFDRRTAADSIFVHGQIRRLDEPFVDGDGRVYLYPPARPNDREVVQPYRLAWPRPEAWMPRPLSEWVDAGGGTPAQREALGAV